jgi:hypothetical protein
MRRFRSFALCRRPSQTPSILHNREGLWLSNPRINLREIFTSTTLNSRLQSLLYPPLLVVEVGVIVSNVVIQETPLRHAHTFARLINNTS